ALQPALLGGEVRAYGPGRRDRRPGRRRLPALAAGPQEEDRDPGRPGRGRREPDRAGPPLPSRLRAHLPSQQPGAGGGGGLPAYLLGVLRVSATSAPQSTPPGPPRGGRVMAIVNPATGQPLRELAEDGPEAIARKVEKARRPQAEWARTPLETRKKAIAAFAAAVEKGKESLAATLTSEMGKPITQSRNELTALQSRLRFFLDHV